MKTPRMKRKKNIKRASLLLAMLMLFSLCACAKPDVNEGDSENGLAYAEEQVLRLVYQIERPLMAATSVNTTSQNSTHPSSAEGLLARNQYGILDYALADSLSANEDKTVYTFHIREGVYWVNHEGEKMAELTAEDFVTSAHIVCQPSSAAGTAFCYDRIIAGASEYIRGKSSDFSTVGVKALDKYTVEYTLSAPTPYFVDLCVNYVPVPTAFYAEQGERYGTSCENTYFISCYYLTEWEDKAYRTYVKNPHYWDADNVFIERIEMTYNAEAERLEPELFERGEVDTAVLSTSVVDDWKQDAEKADMILPGDPNMYKVFFYSFCYDSNFRAHDLLKDFSDENYSKALDNENFRQSIYWAFDRYRTKLTADPYTPERYILNTITPSGWSHVDGTDFTKLDAFREITGRENYSYDKAVALDYKEKALQELTAAGVTFPIKMPMPFDSGSSVWPNEVQVVKQQLEGLLGADYIELTPLPVTAAQYMDAIRNGLFGFTKISATSMVRDPFNWAFHFMPGSSYTAFDKAATPNLAALSTEYFDLLGKANSITDNSAERANAFAEAESFLLEHAIVVPYSMDANGGYFMAGRINPLERAKDGNTNFKYMHVLAEPLTREQYDALHEEYLAACKTAMADSPIK